MVHRTRRGDATSGKSVAGTLVTSPVHQIHQGAHLPPHPGPLTGPPNMYHNQVPGGQVGAMEPLCQCITFLDPYPNGQTSQWRSLASPSLSHYCRVCNTQLNSCKQARIHVTGKKHEKRLAYLKFSLETGEQGATVSPYQGQYLATQAPVSGSTVMSTAIPTVYAYPPPCGTTYAQPGPAYYFPGGVAGLQPQHYHAPYQQASYHDYQVTGQNHSSVPPQTTPSSSTSHPPCHPVRGARHNHGTTPASASHGVMSPSLTSGFSGSGDCKSTETCSLLSVASYSSATAPGGSGGGSGDGAGREGGDGRQHTEAGSDPASGTGSGSGGIRHVVSCETCHLPFPSRAVLEHHLMGSRHARKVKAESVLRQLQENGAEFRATEATGDIRCEVCEVSVNSSHQLQAHMTGHKHKMRCARQGVAPHRTILTPASSTAPSTTPSEASAPVRSHSILVGRPQFGSRPNLYHKTGTGPRTLAAMGQADRRVRGDRPGALASRVQKMRKIVRPRLKAESGGPRQHLRLGGTLPGGGEQGGEVGLETQGQDSTTESDEPGTSKQTSQISILKKEEAAKGEESDEAKESETDHEGPPEPHSNLTSKYSGSVSSLAKASQTEPLRRLSLDIEEAGANILQGGQQEDFASVDSVSAGEQEVQTLAKEIQEPRRRSLSATYGQTDIASFQCNLCQISLNSQSQVAQHMGSSKHRRAGAALQTKGEQQGARGMVGRGARMEGRDCNVREIPMLSMFLQRLHQHHYFPPIRDEEDGNGTETHR